MTINLIYTNINLLNITLIEFPLIFEMLFCLYYNINVHGNFGQTIKNIQFWDENLNMLHIPLQAGAPERGG